MFIYFKLQQVFCKRLEKQGWNLHQSYLTGNSNFSEASIRVITFSWWIFLSSFLEEEKMDSHISSRGMKSLITCLCWKSNMQAI